MENVITRHRNLIVLAAVLFAQVIGLAVQVKRPSDHGSARLIRVWTVGTITPLERACVHSADWARHLWRDYFYLRDVRRENDQLRDENTRLRLDQVRMAEDAGQAQRLQSLLQFKEQFISETAAAQVIGSSGSEQSRLVYIDKGARDGIKADMAVITPAGIVGKIIGVWPHTAQVLEINDQSSGVGAILEKSRLQGIVKGTPAGETMLHYVMSDEKVEPGDLVLTSGGDRIFPKGLPIGRVVQVNPGTDMFLNIRVKPAARLDRVEEVLIITKVVDQEPALPAEGPMRASEILAQRLPTVQPRPPAPATAGAAAGTPATGTPGVAPPAGAKPETAAAATKLATSKPIGSSALPKPVKANAAGPAAKPKVSGAPPPPPAPSPAAVKVISDEPARPKSIPAAPKPARPKPVVQNHPASEVAQ